MLCDTVSLMLIARLLSPHTHLTDWTGELKLLATDIQHLELKMAETHFDDFDHLVTVLNSSKAVFFQENANLPEVEIHRLWKLRWKCLSVHLDGTSERCGSVIPSQRTIPRTLSGDGHPPSKRQELVGPPCPRPPLLGLTGFPEPVVSRP